MATRARPRLSRPPCLATPTTRMIAASALSHGWWAIVGPVPASPPSGVITTPHDRTRALAGPCQVGPLQLRSGNKRLVEYRRSEPRVLDGITREESWPVIVEGHSDVDRLAQISGEPSEVFAAEPRWPETEQRGARELHRLCGLVSLAWGESWQVRKAPKPLGQLSPEVPDSWPSPPQWFSGEDGLLEPRPTPLPAWVIPAWDVIHADRHVDVPDHGILPTSDRENSPPLMSPAPPSMVRGEKRSDDAYPTPRSVMLLLAAEENSAALVSARRESPSWTQSDRNGGLV